MKKGFTLAEILVAIAILGIIAAMTMPTLSAQFLKVEVETNFKKVVSVLENANAMLMHDKEAVNLDDAIGVTSGTSAWDMSKAYINAIAPYVNAKAGITGTVEYFEYYSASRSLLITAESPSLYVADSGTFAMYPRNADRDKGYYEVLVDLNGPSKKPNSVGRDFHLLAIEIETGKVYGYGSKKAPVFRSGGGWYGDRWENKCPSGRQTMPGSDAFSCAGSIMDNGGKIIYKW